MLRQGATKLGAMVGAFRIVGPLGEGGFGSVYEAIDTRTEQRVALKQLTRASSTALSLFKQEFRGLADLHHPNLVGLKGLFEDGGAWYIAMELVEGDELLSYVRREGARFDETRLRRALRGVAQGLLALHQYGFLHRDLKPSNVRVTRDGTAVLLDFGLIASIDPRSASSKSEMVGTVAYMAPEQIAGERIDYQADWYAFGTCLYEALTGSLPFAGDSTQLAIAKLRKQPLPPCAMADDVPSDLEELCVALLALDPAQRPSGQEVLHRLGGISNEQSRAELATQAAPVSATFAGREAELTLLDRALARTHEGELRLVLVEGESGVGKSALVEEFLRRLRARDARTIALRGRCYENEQVPYKAFDGCIDELANELTRLSVENARALLPPRAPLLAQLFPVLRAVPALAKARAVDASADPTVRRLEAFSALSQLLAKMAEERPLVLVVDDLQWADEESFRLLHALAQDGGAPPVLILATVRPREELESGLLEPLETLRAWRCTDVITLTGLPSLQAQALAQKLLGADDRDNWSRVIAEESRGHPLFLSELVHYTRSHDLRAGMSLTLDAALEARVARLEPGARELLEIVALASRPYGAQLFAQALGLATVDDSAKLLLSTKLLRTRAGNELGVFHDRIRHVVVGMIARARRPQLHRALAQSLADTLHEDSREQARHWDLAGNAERAVRAYERAGEQALSTLAFGRAEQLYARALVLLSGARDEYYARLLVQRAHALGCGARSAEAATLYAEAAELAQGEQRIRWRSRAARDLLRSAQTEPGMRAASSLLKELGLSMPTTEAAALRQIAWNRLRVALRGHNFETRARQPEDDAELLALDTIQELSMPLLFVSPTLGLAMYMEHARRAQLTGDQAHVALACSNEGWLLAQRQSLAAAEPFFAQAYKLLEPLNEPAWLAYNMFAEGSARIIHWDLARAESRLEDAHRLLQTQCAGEPWLLTNVRLTFGGLWRNTGAHKRLATQTELWLSEALERKDFYARAILVGLGFGHMRHLMQDNPSRALEELREAMEPVPRTPHAYAHLGEYVASLQSLLYAGGRAALEWQRANDARYDGSFLFGTRLGTEVRALFAAMAPLRACEEASASERKELLAQSRRYASKLRKVGSPFAVAHAQFVMAQVFALENSRERALDAAKDARRRFDKMGHAASRAAAYLEGSLEGGHYGAELRESALLAYQAQGWKEPFRGLALTAPALPLLREASTTRSTNRDIKLIRDRYEVLRTLGSGGFGTVVEALDHKTGTTIALKELVRASAGALGRFKQEFRVMQDVHHSNLVRLDALFEEQGAWYIAMELVTGSDLISWIREPGDADETRLLHAFTGLMHAVSALHEAGLVHRDINPGNVRVTQDGRVVLLDFGLVARAQDARDAKMVGTAEYVPPEQLEGHEPERAADLYAIGVCLYQALTGRLPFTASTPASFALRKRRDQPTPPAALQPDVPAELSALCIRLLSPEPTARPALAEMQRTLNALLRQRSAKRAPSQPPPGPIARTEFAGRERELEVLRRSFQETLDGHFSLCVIEGESGLGKSALMAEFARRTAHKHGALQPLKSRCYENEQIAFKAFDGVVDELALLLSERPAVSCEALLPKRVALLAQLFPVLGMVPAIAQAPKKGLPVEPSTRRIEALRCFVELLSALAHERPLLLLIDDLQWADDESFALLRELIATPQPPPLMIVCTARPVDELEGKGAEALARLHVLSATTRIPLAPLAQNDVERLVRSLLGHDADDQHVRKLTQESKGHPLFARELVEHVRLGATDTQRVSTLDEALLSRIDKLSPSARELLEAVSILGKPHGVHLLLRALCFDGAQHEAITLLLAQGLVRRRGDQGLTVSHDRMRRVVLDAIAPQKRAELCRRLAEELERESADAVERARLWDEASDPARATDAYEQAAAQALAGLTFVRAEQLARRALVLKGAARDEQTQRLLVLRGHALARAGAGEEAASVYREAAAHAEGDAKTRLRVWAAQQLIQSLQIEQGLQDAGALLAELSAPLPGGELAALGRIAWERANMPLGGVDLTKRTPKVASGTEQLTLDTLHELMLPIYVVAPWPGSALTVRYLRRALSYGSLPHLARALGLECTLRSISAPRADHEAIMAESMALAERTGDPAVMAGVGLTLGTARIVQCRFDAAREHMERVQELVQTQCPGEPWMLTNARMHLGWIWQLTGQYAQLSQHMSGWLVDARERNDRFAYGIFASYGAASLRHLMNGEPETMLRELASAMEPWPDEPFGFPHLGEATMSTYAHRYQGGDGAFVYLERQRAYLDNRYVRLNPSAKLLLTAARGTAALEAIDSLETSTAHRLIARARKDAMRAGKIASPLSQAAKNSLLAGVEALSGNREQALAHARLGQALYAPTRHFLGQALGYLEGLLEGGISGRLKRERVVTFLAQQGWRDAPRALSLHLPNLRLLHARYEG